MAQEKEFLFLLGKAEYLLRRESSVFRRHIGQFSEQFFQLYSSHVHRESTSHKNYIHSVVSALLVDKKKQHIIVC
jgi:hypothetical protein